MHRPVVPPENLPSVNLREVQVQQQEIGLGSSARLSYMRYPSQRFRTIVDNMQLMQDVILPERLLHQQDIPGVIFGQEYDGVCFRGLFAGD